MALEKEKRKILRVGEASYAITIPKKWCRELGIGVGDLVELEKHEDSIIVRPPKEKTVEEAIGLRIALDATRRNTKQLVEEVIGAYIEGVSEIHLKGRREVIEETVKVLRRKIPGMVVLPGLKGYSYKLTFMEAPVDVAPIIEKFSTTLNQVFGMMRNALFNANENALEELRDLEEEVEWIYYLGLRASKKNVYQSSSDRVQDVIDSIIVLRDLKEIADSIIRLAKMLAAIPVNDKKILADEAYKMLSYLQELYEASITSYIGNDINKALTVLGKEDTILEYINDILGKLGKHVAMVAEEILPVIRSSMSIARITVSRCIRDKACRCRFFPLLE